jgi:hypothetical protein
MILGLALASALGVTTAAAVAQQKGTEAPPDATLTFSGGSIAVGIGYSWGGGTLTFKGQRHDFTANGLNVINVGASSVEATGDVYHFAPSEMICGLDTCQMPKVSKPLRVQRGDRLPATTAIT